MLILPFSCHYSLSDSPHGFELWSGHPERRIPDHYVALKDARCDEEWDRSCRNAGTFDGSRLDYETLLATAELIRLIDKIRPGIGLLMFDACHVGGSTKAVRVANWDNGYVSGSSINDAMASAPHHEKRAGRDMLVDATFYHIGLGERSLRSTGLD